MMAVFHTDLRTEFRSPTPTSKAARVSACTCSPAPEVEPRASLWPAKKSLSWEEALSQRNKVESDRGRRRGPAHIGAHAHHACAEEKRKEQSPACFAQASLKDCKAAPRKQGICTLSSWVVAC